MALTKDIIAKYLQESYIETGCAMGDTLQQAIDAGAKYVDGIEIQGECVKHCQKRFRRNRGVQIHRGMSEQHLGSILMNKPEKALIYLDAHKVSKNGEGSYPLWIELGIIDRFRKIGHTIMIDDIRLCGGVLPPLNNILVFLSRINKKYKIAYEDSITNEKDTLVAYL